MKNIFISYSNGNIAFKKNLEKFVSENNYDVKFIDFRPEYFPSKDKWKRIFKEEIKNCDGFIAFVTKDLFTSVNETWKIDQVSNMSCVPVLGIFPKGIVLFKCGCTQESNWKNGRI